MALWGNKDQSNNSPIFGPALVNKTPNTANRDALYENTTANAIVPGQTVGVYGNQTTEAGPAGWVLKRTGSGGRAGRITEEVLVAMRSLTQVISEASYWISTLGSVAGGAYLEWGRAVTTDLDGNIYVIGASTGYLNMLLVKYSSSGTVLWQRTLGDGINTNAGRDIVVDNNGYVYIVGYSSASGTNDIITAKYSSEGVIQWQRVLNNAGNEGGYGIVVNDSGVYVASYGSDAIIVKYSSTGTIQWQRTLGMVGNDGALGIDIDSVGDVYICGLTENGGSGSNDLLVAKYSSTGTIQWQRTLGNGGLEKGSDIVIDSNDNIYTCSGEGSDILIAKYSNAGTLLWQRLLSNASSDYAYSIAADSNDNIYIVGEGDAAEPNFNGYIIKYDSDGVFQFARGFGLTTTVYNTLNGITIDSNDDIVVVGETDTNTDALAVIVKLPNDGSMTGTYGDFSYYEITEFTDSEATYTAQTSTLTDQVSTFTNTTSSLTDQEASFPSALIPIV